MLVWDISDYTDLLRNNSKTQAEGSSGSSSQQKSAEVPFCRYISASAIESGHKNVITDIQWIDRHIDINYQGDITAATEPYPNQFITTSLDGYLFFWDLRFKKDLKSLDLAWKPFYRAPMMIIDGSTEYGLTKLALDQKVSEDLREKTKSMQELDKDDQPILVTKFYCGTEEGDLIYADWIADRKASEEKSKMKDKDCCS